MTLGDSRFIWLGFLLGTEHSWSLVDTSCRKMDPLSCWNRSSLHLSPSLRAPGAPSPQGLCPVPLRPPGSGHPCWASVRTELCPFRSCLSLDTELAAGTWQALSGHRRALTLVVWGGVRCSLCPPSPGAAALRPADPHPGGDPDTPGRMPAGGRGDDALRGSSIMVPWVEGRGGGGSTVSCPLQPPFLSKLRVS